MLHQFFNHITILNSLNSNFRFSQTNVFLKSFNSVLYMYLYFQEGKTALHLAAEEGHLETVDVLCDFNASPNSETIVSRGPEVVKMSCSTQLTMNFFLLINIKMPTIVGILTFVSWKNSNLGLSEPEQS